MSKWHKLNPPQIELFQHYALDPEKRFIGSEVKLLLDHIYALEEELKELKKDEVEDLEV